MQQRLTLVGAGHSHLEVLNYLMVHKPARLEVLLIAPRSPIIYSGMVPAVLCANVALQNCHIDIAHVARKAGVTWLAQEVVAVNVTHRTITLDNETVLTFDWLSINVGALIDTSWLAMADSRLVPAKPIEPLIQRLNSLLTSAAWRPASDVVVIGGGAAGVELSLAIKSFFQQNGIESTIHLVTSELGVMHRFPERARWLVNKALYRAGITVHFGRAVGHPLGILLANGNIVNAELVIAATGVTQGVRFSEGDDFQRSDQGLIVVDQHLRCVGQSRIFAAGDGCVVDGLNYPRCGANAVRAGKILAQNLIASMAGTPLHKFKPRKRPLTLLRTGNRDAILTWGPLALAGRWCCWLKDRIDQRYMRRWLADARTSCSDKQFSPSP